MREIVERIVGIEEELKRRSVEDELALYNSGEKKHLKQQEYLEK